MDGDGQATSKILDASVSRAICALVTATVIKSAFGLMAGGVLLPGHDALRRFNEALDALDLDEAATADADALYPAALDVFVKRDTTDPDGFGRVIDAACDRLHCFVSCLANRVNLAEQD